MKQAEKHKAIRQAKKEIEDILEKYQVTLYYEDDEGCKINDICLYKERIADIEIDIKDYGKIF
jgi:hypothetical protein